MALVFYRIENKCIFVLFKFVKLIWKIDVRVYVMYSKLVFEGFLKLFGLIFFKGGLLKWFVRNNVVSWRY